MDFFDTSFAIKPLSIRSKTLYWSGSDSIKNYKKENNPYSKTDITYVYNRYGFRSDEFCSSNYRLLFLGCSHTEGIGLPLEETFAYKVYSTVKNKIGKDFPFWNLGLGGNGMDAITRAYYNFHDLLKPQVVVAVLPTYRIEFFVNNAWNTILPNYDPRNILEKNPYLSDLSVMIYNTQKNFALLDLLMEKHKTLLLWDTWDKVIIPKIDTSKLSNFSNSINSWNKMEKKYKSKARDGLHCGKDFHNDYARTIVDMYGEKICERLTN